MKREEQEDFFKDFHKESRKTLSRFALGAGVMWMVGAAVTLAMLGAAVWVVILVLQWTGVIA